MSSRLVDLALVFVPLSFVTIGGGVSALAEIHRQVVDVHQWLTEAQFVTDYAISRMAPGPGSVLVTLIGYQVAGIPGAIVSTLAIFLPTALLIYFAAVVWTRHGQSRFIKALERGLKPVAAGMLLSAFYVLFRALDGGWAAQGVALASSVVLAATRIYPMLVIASGALLLVGFQWIGIS